MSIQRTGSANDKTMLPDYPKAKQRLAEQAHWIFETSRASVLPPIKASPIVEGHRGRIWRSDGSSDDIDLKKFSSSIEIEKVEYLTLSWEDMLRRVAAAGKALGFELAEMLFAKMEEVTQQTGNWVDAKGSASADSLFEMFRKIEIDFHPDGTPDLPHLYAGEAAAKAMGRVLEEIQQNPTLRNKFEEILSQKRELWRDRESSRKLVD